MSDNQLEQREREDMFYTDLFVRSGTWSGSTPNDDERLRWEKIKGFLSEILEQLSRRNHQSLRILDVGCGRGWLTNLLTEYGYCEGIEPVKTVVEYARTLFPNLVFHVGFPGDLLVCDDFQPYDLIVTSEVIEHIPNIQKNNFIDTLRRLLKPNGAVILTTPRGEVWDQWKSVSTPNQPVEDWITESDLLDRFQSCGFSSFGHEQIFFDLGKFQYVDAPPPGESTPPDNIIALYQIWAFSIGVGLQKIAESSDVLNNGGWTQNSVPEHTPVSASSQIRDSGSEPDTPLISVIVPTFNRPDMLKRALQSIAQQIFTDYEIIVVNDGGIDVADTVTSFNERHNITCIHHGKNRGLAAARNSGIGVARGKYIAYLDDDDRFAPDHLQTLVSFLEQSHLRIAYSDAWRIVQRMEHGEYVEVERSVPYSHDFNPDTLLISNYFPVLCVMHEKACLEKTGGFDETLTTHEDWDLWIRLSRHFPFAHLKQTTAEFTWRTDGSSMTSRITEDFLRTKRLIYKKYEEYFRLQPHLIPIKEKELQDLESRSKSRTIECSIIIPLYNMVELTRQCLLNLAQVTTEVRYEVVLVDNHSTDGTNQLLSSLGGDVQIIRNPSNLGFAKACNQGARVAKGEHLVFLNNDTIPLKGWLEALLEEVRSHSDVDIVGSKLLYPDNTIQHAGVVLSRGPLTPYHVFHKASPDLPAVNIRKEFQAVTAACMLVRKKIFDELGGFDEDFVNGFEDVDFCLRVRQLGKKVVYQPQSCLYHLESQSPGRKKHDLTNAKRFIERWKHMWLVDEDLVAHQDGYIIQNGLNVEEFYSYLVPISMVKNLSTWTCVVRLQQALLGQACQPLADMPNRHEVRELLTNSDAWPNDIGILEWVGRVCVTLHCETEAEKFWEKLLLLGDHPNARLGLARAHLKKGNCNEAQQHLNALARHFKPREEGFTLQGILLMQQTDYVQAKQAFEQALALDDVSTKARMGLGMANLGLGQALEAWRNFEQILRTASDDVEAMRCLIQAGTALERWEDLVSHLLRFVERNPADCDMRYALAGCQFRAGLLDQAKQQANWLRLVKPGYKGLEDLVNLLQAARTEDHLVSTH